MSKEHRTSREAKKQPSLSPKERKALKKSKKEARKLFEGKLEKIFCWSQHGQQLTFAILL